MSMNQSPPETAREAKAPIYSLMWNMTRKCNFRCRYCYFPHDSGAIGPDEVLDAERVLAFLDEAGTEWTVGMTGGEPFIYPGFVDICARLTERHRIGVDTNLSVSREVKRFAERIDPARVQDLYVALHIEERERRNGVESFVENVLLLKERGFRVIVNSVVHPTLVDRFLSDREFFAARGIEIVPRPFKGTFEDRRYPAAYGKDAARIFAGYPEAGVKLPLDFRGVPCDGGFSFLRMEPDGTVFRCSGDKTVYGNVNTGARRNPGPLPCAKAKCPCRGIDHVHLSPARADFVEGIKRLVVGEYGAARERFEAVLAAAPEGADAGEANAAALNNLGLLDWREGDRASAVARFRRARECDPQDEVFRHNADAAGGFGFEPRLSVAVGSCR